MTDAETKVAAESSVQSETDTQVPATEKKTVPTVEDISGGNPLVDRLTKELSERDVMINKLRENEKALRKQATRGERFEVIVREQVDSMKSGVAEELLLEINQLPIETQHSILGALKATKGEDKPQLPSGLSGNTPAPRPAPKGIELSAYEQEKAELAKAGRLTGAALAKLAKKYRGQT